MNPTHFSRTCLPRLSISLVAALLVMGCGVHRAPLPDDSASPRIEAQRHQGDLLASQLAASVASADGEDQDAADSALSAVIGHPAFRTLPDEQRHQALSVAAFVAIRLDELPRARDLYLAATRVDPADPDDWFRLSLIERELGDHEASAAHLLHLLRAWPELLGNLPEHDISLLVHQMAPASPARLEVLQTLFDASWTRNGLGASVLWYELALMRVERGETEEARPAIARITEPMDVVKLRADRRFDAVVDRDDVRFDAARAARKRADELRVMAMLEPERLDVLRELTYAMLTAGDNRDVLAMTDAALAVIPAGDEASPFQDTDDQVWLMNNRAIALRRLGHIDEALEQMEHASRLTEQGEPNVSQLLNLGQFYCSLGRPDDALKVIAKAGEMSGYGRMVQASVQHCAARRSGDAASAAHALAYLRRHRQDSEIHFVEALIEAERLDEAAAVLVALLESPHDRADALIAVQKFQSTEPLPGDVAYRARGHGVIARADVQAAVQRVGRAEHHGIHAGNGTD